VIEHTAIVATSALRKDTYKEGSVCLLAWEPPPHLLIAERAEYLVWHLALEALASMLAGKLETIGVLPPSAPTRPWAGEIEAGRPQRIYDNGRSPVYRPYKRAPVRAGGRRPLPRASAVRRLDPQNLDSRCGPSSAADLTTTRSIG
jgi:hypothetical protein